MKKLNFVLINLILFSMIAFSQENPRINALFPAGGQIGRIVEVAIKGSSLDDPRGVIIEGGDGIIGELISGSSEIDETNRDLFESACSECHEIRSPSNRTMTPAQWEAIVDRMMREKGASIENDEREKIIDYLKSAARANAGLMVKFVISPTATIGNREMRIVGKYGVSTAFPFEISDQRETIDAEPNDTIDDAAIIDLPIIINGTIERDGDHDFFAFDANAGDRLVFSVKAYRLNRASQQFFNPTITLFDHEMNELARSNGFYALDPLIDHEIKNDGTYFLRIRDLLYRGNPSCVYRMIAGVMPYNTYIFPTGGQIGCVIETEIGGENLENANWEIDLSESLKGLQQITTPYGIFPFVVSDAETIIENGKGDPIEHRGSENLVDSKSEILFQTKCVACHELRSPSNRALSADEWTATIQRMQGKPNADMTDSDRDRITEFILAESQRIGRIVAKAIENAQEISNPGGVSGRILSNGESDYYKFEIPMAKRLGPWWVIHPFDNPGEAGFDIAYPPETEIDLEKTYIGKNDRDLRWYKTRGRGESVFSNVPEDDVIGYALTYVESDEDRIEMLSLGSDDGIKVWVNDELIWSHFVHRALQRAQDVIAMPLKKGRNKILIKISNGWGPWGFFATIGGYSIDLVAERIGSPLSPSLTLLNADGRILRNNAGVGGQRNARIDYSFRNPGVYAIRVEDLAGNAGESYTYHLSLTPAKPDFELVVTPDNINVGRGGTQLLTVTATRRVGFSGDIKITVDNLPKGIRTSGGAILKDVDQAFITLTAEESAEFGYNVIDVVGSVKTSDVTQILRSAIPIEVYQIRNQNLTVRRKSIVAAVTQSPKITISVEPRILTVQPDRSAKLKVIVDRNGSRQDLTLRILGLPSGVRLQRDTIFLNRDRNEIEIEILPNVVATGVGNRRENPFVGREMDRLPYNIVVSGSIGNRVVAVSPATKLSIGQ